jgi:hypothetical protein
VQPEVTEKNDPVTTKGVSRLQIERKEPILARLSTVCIEIITLEFNAVVILEDDELVGTSVLPIIKCKCTQL